MGSSFACAKAKWKHGKTKTIRVPEVLVPQILEYSKKLDNEAIIENVSQSKTVPGIPETGLPVLNQTWCYTMIQIYQGFQLLAT